MRPLGFIGDGWRLAQRNGRRRQLLRVGAFYVVESNIEEAIEYLAELAPRVVFRIKPGERHRRRSWRLCGAFRRLSLRETEQEAMARIGQRDPRDWSAVAGAIQFDCPVWTEDEDFLGLACDLDDPNGRNLPAQ